MITMKCVHCRAVLKVKPKLAGRRVKCPKCSSLISVAKLDETGEASPAVSEQSGQLRPEQPTEHSSTVQQSSVPGPAADEVQDSPIPFLVDGPNETPSYQKYVRRQKSRAPWIVAAVLLVGAAVGSAAYFTQRGEQGKAQPPRLAPIPDQRVQEHDLFQLKVEATASEGSGGLTYSLVNPPDGVTIDKSGLLRWTPSEDQGPGDYKICVRVTARQSKKSHAQQSFNVTVSEHNSLPASGDLADAETKAESHGLNDTRNNTRLAKIKVSKDVVGGSRGKGQPSQTVATAATTEPSSKVEPAPAAKPMPPQDQQANVAADGSNGESIAPADEKEAKQVLEKLGIRVLSSGLLLPDESKLSRSLRGVKKLRKFMSDADKQLQAIKQKSEVTRNTITALRRQHVQLSAQLTRATNVAANNRLVGALNAIEGQMTLLTEQLEQRSKQTKESRGKMVQAREAYLQHVLDMRELADKISGQYAAKAADKKVKTVLAQLNEVTGKDYKLTPSRGFQSNSLRLKKLEDLVLSATIKLRKERGDSLFVSVVINGKHTKEMVVDSGASSIALPHKVAAECGLEPSASAPTIMLRLANGAIIPGKLITIPEVRVGKFTVKDVEGVVFGPEATYAESLLGMSFLGHFKFEIDAQAGTLTMVKVETSTPSTSSSRKKQ